VRAESAILGGVAAFLVVAATVYWFWSYEDAGTVLLTLAAAFAATTAVYLRRSSGRLPPASEPSEIVGWFPTASIWPLGTGGGAVLVGMGLVFGVWLTLVGAVLLVASVLGYAFADRTSSPGSEEGGSV
jgi:hypothetical protein